MSTSKSEPEGAARAWLGLYTSLVCEERSDAFPCEKVIP